MWLPCTTHQSLVRSDTDSEWTDLHVKVNWPSFLRKTTLAPCLKLETEHIYIGGSISLYADHCGGLTDTRGECGVLLVGRGNVDHAGSISTRGLNERPAHILRCCTGDGGADS